MSYANQTQYLGLLERVSSSIVTTVPCCVFLFINGTLLFTLRSKPVFCATPRYILLFNLLFADTVQMALSQLMYVIAACRILLTYPVCGVLNMLSILTGNISPLTLVVMCLERFVAVCYPLRHTNIITIRNTGGAVTGVWTFSSLNVLTRVILLIIFPFEDLQMKDVCSITAMFLYPVSAVYDKAYTCFLFVSAGLVITSSYIGVMIAARSASTDKASVRKARNTLLLHLVQLGLILSSTLLNSLLLAISQIVTRLVTARIQVFFYLCMVLLPRCLSALIYGLRDQTIRPVLMYNLCFRLKCSVAPAKAKFHGFGGQHCVFVKTTHAIIA